MVLQFPHFDPRVKPPLGTQLDRSDAINCGLVAYLLGNEGAGMIVNDVSGRSHVGTFTNALAWTPTPYGPGISGTLNSSECLTVVDSPDLRSMPGLTLVVLARNNASAIVSSDVEFLVLKGTNQTNGNYCLYWDQAEDVRFGLLDTSGGDKYAVYTDGLTDSNWHLWAATWDGATMTLYKDGVSRATTAAAVTMSANTSTLKICGNGDNASWNGQIATTMIYNRALTASEIARLYREPFCVLRRPASRAWLGAMSAGGTNHALGGSVAAAASLSATLSIARPLSGSANAIAIPTGGIAVARSAAGSAAGQSSLSGSLGVARTLVGQIAAQPQVAASVVVARSLAGQIAGQSSMSGTLSTQGQVSLSGSISAASSAGGSLSATRSLDGHVTATAVAAASLSRTIALSGRVEAATSLLAAGSIVRSLSGGIDATASLTASTEIARSLSGSIAASASLSGSLLTPGGGSVTAIFLMLKKRR